MSASFPKRHLRDIHNCLRFDISQSLLVHIIQFCTVSQETRPLEGLWPLQFASIDHGRSFRCANGAPCSICSHRTGVDGVSGCWSTHSARGLMRDCFRGAVVLDLTALRAPLRPSSLLKIAVGDAYDGAEGIIY